MPDTTKDRARRFVYTKEDLDTLKFGKSDSKEAECEKCAEKSGDCKCETEDEGKSET